MAKVKRVDYKGIALSEYPPLEWENNKTPLNALNLNNMEHGIAHVTGAVYELLDSMLPNIDGEITKLNNDVVDMRTSFEHTVTDIETDVEQLRETIDEVKETSSTVVLQFDSKTGTLTLTSI